MTPERKGSKVFSRSEKIHTRRKKQKDRDNTDRINQIIEMSTNKWGLANVNKLLSPDNPKLLIMNDMEKAIYHASLEIEKSWWELKCGVINEEQQKQLLSEYMDNLLTTMPDVYNVLVGDELRPSIARKIHDKVFPPKPPGLRVKR